MTDNLLIKPSEDENPPAFYGGGDVGYKTRGYKLVIGDNLKYMDWKTYNNLNISTYSMSYNPNFKTLSIDTVAYV
jgi:hypothetical protein